MKNHSIQDPESWVDLHGDVLYRFALLRVKDPHIAEDLVQETFVSALVGWEKFKAGSSVRTWLVGILKHKIVDHYRSSARTIPTSDLDAASDVPGEEKVSRHAHHEVEHKAWVVNPSNLMENKEFWETFLECLGGLPEAARRAFSLREIDGYKSGEICKILDISSTNLWVILHRARAKLRDCLEAKWFSTR